MLKTYFERVRDGGARSIDVATVAHTNATAADGPTTAHEGAIIAKRDPDGGKGTCADDKRGWAWYRCGCGAHDGAWELIGVMRSYEAAVHARSASLNLNLVKVLKPGDAPSIQRLEMMRLLSHDIHSIDTAELSGESSQMSDNIPVAIIDEPVFIGKSTAYFAPSRRGWLQSSNPLILPAV